MPLPESIREEFIHALATYSRYSEEASEETLMTAHEAAENLFYMSRKLGLIDYLPVVEETYYANGTLFVVVDGEVIEIPRW